MNNAGYYLLSNQKPLLLKLATYPTDERIAFSDMKQFRGNIFECIDEAVKYVTNNIRWSARIVGMERKEVPEIPLEAFREIILNSFAHMRVNDTSANEIYGQETIQIGKDKSSGSGQVHYTKEPT